MSDGSASGLRFRRRLAWVLPVLVAGGVVAGVALSTATSSGASPTLPSRSPAQLLVAVQRSAGTALAGQVTERADLGLPSLPADQSSASLSWQSFLTGSHSARVWVDGATKQRVALLGELSEADVVHNGRDVWTYTSDSNAVSHTVLPAASGTRQVPNALDYTPAQAADRLLKAISPSTAVSVDASRTVAGRAAYTLVLRPRDTRSTVREVTIAIDATTFVPLQVQVYGTGSTPAFQTGFTRISYARPSSSIFTFRPPAGATVSRDPFGAGPGQERHRAVRAPVGMAPPMHPSAAPKVIGSGWTSVLELNAAGRSIAIPGGLGGKLTSTIGASGDRLLHTALINAVFTPDGRVFVGAVRPTLLEHIAATTPR